MAKIRINRGTFNVRGLKRAAAAADRARYEFATEVAGVGRGPAGKSREQAGPATNPRGEQANLWGDYY